MNKTKKTVLITALVVIMLFATSFTLAFLNDSTQAVTNTFFPSEVTSKVNEIFDGKEKKDVSISNTGDVPAYIRAEIIVNWEYSDEDDADETKTSDVISAQLPVEGENGDYLLQFKDYSLEPAEDGYWFEKDGYYYWSNPVAAGEQTGILISKLEQLATARVPAGCQLSAKIICSAIQADGEKLDGADNGKSPVELAWGVTVKENGTLAAN